MSGELRTGFTTFKHYGDLSKDFIDDVNFMISKVYSQWSLYEDEEEFNSSCWTKIIKSLPIYDSACGALSTFLNRVVWNEATRIHSKHKKMAMDDITEKINLDPLWRKHHEDHHDFLHRDRVCTFARRAFNMGVYIDQQELYKNYSLGNLSPAVKSFMWYFILRGESGKYAN